MHTDEAVHAIKFGTLLEEGRYTYDPNEYHGPTLNYLTLVPARLSSAEKLNEVNEFTLRIVPVFFGVLLVLLLLLIADGMGASGAVFAAILTAISPAMVFYSRYYIQEMLLVCFTFALIVFSYHYTKSKKIVWIILAGMSLGLMHATKETAILALGSMLLALLLIRLGGKPPVKLGAKYPIWHLIACLATVVLISVLFYSSFFTNPGGILDSVRTYAAYFDRASVNSLHFHPWYYYLKMLLYFRLGSGPVWSEAFIVILAVIGFIVVVRGKSSNKVDFNLLRFIAFYTLIMTIIYSAIRHKTPWCMLSFLHGMILLAGVGAATLMKLFPRVFARTVISLLLLAGGAQLAWQSYLANYRYYADPCNPYAYAHTTTDIFTMVNRIEEVAAVDPKGRNMEIHFICPDGHDFWPFPWYLRSFPNVGYWTTVTDRVVFASVIIAQPSVEKELLTKLYELPPPGKKQLYISLFDTYSEIRPAVELRGYVPKELFDKSIIKK
ncbi:MAG: hypothetical protein A2173_01415 [Planctomycetes bacterium RBG_13_44_8b]|nr:MAG: hypothetical protein A2173_01415 [Planctomycetes bacterium RBG_13_44_8b]